EKFEKVMERVKSGEMFPSGVFIGDYAREQNIPLVYVTSTNHHDLAFEPLRVKLGFPYVDRLIDGLKKDWNSGLEILLD
ncbi:MAG: hypothetical protein KC550_06910, partial [Nanoarchaeota archaeon]|nr:hypothetical protein [Nanoarchaeota archaeon]